MIEIIQNNWLLLLVGSYPHGPVGGLVATLGMAVTSILLALPLSILLALGRISPFAVVRLPATAVVYVVRGVPLLMFIFWAYFLIPLATGTPVPGYVIMVITLAFYESAYLAEIIRAGIQALPAGQYEAGRTLGLPYLKVMRVIILPQALFNMLPSMLNQLVSTVKETSLAYIIATQELTFAADQINNVLLTKPFEVFGLLALTYFALNFALTSIAKFAENKINDKRSGASSTVESVAA
ncbi:amino acid ABC transporter permease [Shinella sp. CPCC 101442]|uniref:amino acid ABC transporter permease n=1 Tax=Shinella sp. CPCC 101442 TaxID=2932265 RepID=UPI0021529F37|nr:amino acid ABC transporter permease [Shinella sp. CPCC 101442]MCR6497419.1 amino acid ABC transporter permease [Shinella sp. CPCC 101442]